MLRQAAYGTALVTLDASGNLLDAWFPDPGLGERQAGQTEPGDPLNRLTGDDPIRQVRREVRRVQIDDLASPPVTSEEVWLRLHLLSHRLVRPHEANLDGVFDVLRTVAWTSLGPCPPEDVPAIRLRALAAGHHLQVTSVDKFPRMSDYVIPSGVRIADTDRVRLGAHLAEGTTVMQEGFVNFNAGTLGPVMVEGRISAGVVVGAHSDVGGGASIMGTLSGGGRQVVTVGERCLIGANAGIGISLGDDCVVAAGTYVTASAKILGPQGKVVKAASLSGQSGLLYWTTSRTGALEAHDRGSRPGITLNETLHHN